MAACEVISVEPSSPTPSPRFFQRHAERADASFALYKGVPYVQSEDYAQYPFDPPLSDDGERGALDLAAEIKSFTQSHDTKIHVVISSPYLRCAQTAAAICHELGPSTILMFDASCGEIFGTQIFGPTQPERVHRDFSAVLEDCKARGARRIAPVCVGTRPQWPESVQDGRQRFNEVFLGYVHRGTEKTRNFLVVTHGDCVAAAGTLLPGAQDISKVHPGGVVMAQRLRPIGPAPGDTWSMMSSERSEDKRTEKAVLKSLSRSQGWRVESFNVEFSVGARSKESVVKRMVASFRKFSARTKLGEDRVKHFLKAFSGDRRKLMSSGSPMSPTSPSNHGCDPANWIFSCEEEDSLARMPSSRSAWIKASPRGRRSPTPPKSPRSPHNRLLVPGQAGREASSSKGSAKVDEKPKTVRSLIFGNGGGTGSTSTTVPLPAVGHVSLEDFGCESQSLEVISPKPKKEMEVPKPKQAYLQLPSASMRRGGAKIKDTSSSPLWRRRQQMSNGSDSTTMSLVEVMKSPLASDKAVEVLSPKLHRGFLPRPGAPSWAEPVPPQGLQIDLPNSLPDEPMLR